MPPFGKYDLRRKLGAGGMGEVWEAFDPVLGRAVAVKLLTGDGTDAAESVREAAAAARVNHPNAVAVYDAVEHGGRWGIVMELVTGPSAAKLLSDRGRLTWTEATRIARDAAAGLAAVHAAGLVHRDVKPANILLTPDGVAKVGDFGLARPSARTTVTSLVGTPLYMSPEQCWNELADARADVYSLGATYFTLLTARPPFAGDTEMAVMYAHCHSPVPDPRAVAADLPAGCTAVVRRAMAKAPADRFASADELRTALASLLAGTTVPIRDMPTKSIRLPPDTTRPRPLPLPRRPFPTRRVAVCAGLAALAAAALTAFACWPRPAAPPPAPPAPPATTPAPPDDAPPWAAEWQVGGDVQQVAVSPDGKRIAVSVRSGEGKGELQLRSRDGKPLPGWPKEAVGVEGVAFPPDGKLVASASRDTGRVMVADVETGRERTVRDGEAVPWVSLVAFSSDGTRLAAGGYDSLDGMRVHFWEREESGAWKKLPGGKPTPEYELWGLAFAPGRSVLAAGVGRTDDANDAAVLRLFDPDTGKELDRPKVNLRRKSIGPPLAFAADGSVLAVGALGAVHLLKPTDWTPAGPPLVLTLGRAETELYSLAVSRDGKWVAGGRDVDIHLWRVEDGAVTVLSKAHDGIVRTLAFSPDGKLLSGGADGVVKVRDPADHFK